MSALFVTGTGTDIGKTFVTAALIQELRRRGKLVSALKPVASGFNRFEAATTDPGILLAALGLPISTEALDRIAPWRFEAPLSPDMAARRENRTLDFDALVVFSRQAVAQAAGALLIEGVGGPMVPLDDTRTVLDWIAALKIAALLVGGSYLGAISHTLTALAALRGAGIGVAAILINETPGSTVPLDETAAVIARFAGTTKTLTLPHRPHTSADHASLRQIADLL